MAVGTAGFALAIWALPGPTGAAASGGTVTISGSMEGNLPVHPGDTIKAGFHISIPGNSLTHDTTVDASGGSVTMTANCDNGGTETITVTLPDQSITIPAGDTGWFPAGGQSDPAVWQGSTTLPGTFCKSSGAHVPAGATFTDTLTDPDNVQLAVQFHYADNTSGSWSATAHTTAAPPGPKTQTTSSTTSSTTSQSSATTTTAQSPTGSVSGLTTSATSAAATGGVQAITSAPNTGARLPLGLATGMVLAGVALASTPWLATRRRRR